ncbi:MAG: pitrilysin family protein [Pseudomonadota bacterium]
MIHFKHLAIPALLFGLFASPAPASEKPVAMAITTSNVPTVAYDKFTLANGLDVILVENHKLPIVAVNLWYHVGAANEKPGLTGFAHLFEHMMFAASKHIPRGVADKLLEGAGGSDSNGTTDFDRTNYYDTVPSNQLELALWTHSDRMGYLLDVLDQTALSNQQDVVRNERRQSIENRPYGIVEEALYHQLFPKTHPYYASVMGSHADIQSAKLGDIRDFFKTYYRPNNASLVIAGDIDKVQARALVAKYFGGFQRGPAIPPLQVVTPPISRERRAVVQDRVELPRVIMGWLTTPAFKPGDAALSVAAQILGGGKTSRLYQALVYEQQIAQDVSASQNSLALTSLFTIDVTARPGHSAEEIEAAIDAELARLRTDGPDEKEMEQARNTIETAMLNQFEKIGGSGLANQLNQYNQYLGDPGYLPKDIERYRQVSAADVRDALRVQLQNNTRAVIYGLPGTPDLGPEVATPAAKKSAAATSAITRVTALNKDESWRRHAPKAAPPRPFSLPSGEQFQLKNGLTVIHHRNPSLPLVAAQIVIKTGSEANPLDRAGLASFTAQMLEEGSTSRSSPQIAQEIAQLGAQLYAASSADASMAQVMSLKANFRPALDLLADVVLHPAFPLEEVERQRSSRLGELSQQREDAGAVASRVTLAALYGNRHPYGTLEIGTEASIKATTRQDLQTFWQQHYVPRNAALIVTGDIGLDELKTLAEASFGGWRNPSTETPVTTITAIPQPSPAQMVLVDKPGAPQTALRIGIIGPARNTPDYEALQVMNAALGGLFTSRLNTVLREQKGYTYGISSAFAYRRQPGPFFIGSSVRTDVTGPAIKAIFKEVRKMLAQPLPAAELRNARNAQVLSLPAQFESNRAINGSLANLYIYDLPLDYYSALPARYASVSATQGQAALKKYLVPEQMIVIAVGDQKKIGAQLQGSAYKAIEYRDADGVLIRKSSNLGKHQHRRH